MGSMSKYETTSQRMSWFASVILLNTPVKVAEGDAMALNAGFCRCLLAVAPDEDCSESTESGAVPRVESGLSAAVGLLPGGGYPSSRWSRSERS